MIFLWIFIFTALVAFLLITCINLALGPRLSRAMPLADTPKISLLIPARNEAETIARCLHGLLTQDYPNFEIIVLDDHSTDETAQIVHNLATQHPKIRLISGAPLKPGWTGKNFACHQLSLAATGEIFIFTDADNWHAPFAVSHTVARMQKKKIGFLSTFPQQQTVSIAEKMVIPFVELFLYSGLPLWLTYLAPFSSLAAANGQWLVFSRNAYQQTGGHAAVKNNLVEDTQLSRIAKCNRVKILMTAGTGTVFCRMYRSPREVWAGFSKNFYGLTGNHTGVFFGIILTLLATFVVPYFLVFYQATRIYALLAIGMNLLLRILLALGFRQPFWTSTLLHPFSTLLVVAIGLNSFIRFKTGKISWKGREILINKPEKSNESI